MRLHLRDFFFSQGSDLKDLTSSSILLFSAPAVDGETTLWALTIVDIELPPHMHTLVTSVVRISTWDVGGAYEF